MVADELDDPCCGCDGPDDDADEVSYSSQTRPFGDVCVHEK